MRMFILASSMMLVSASAFAQNQNASPPSLGFQSARLESEHRANMNTRGKVEECLVRKSNGKRECRSRAEWRKIADNLVGERGSAR